MQLRLGKLLDYYFQRFGAVDASPSEFTKAIWNLRSVLNPTWPLKDKAYLERFLFANSLSSKSDLEMAQCPTLEILIVCKATDSDLLINCIIHAYAQSENPVSQISIMVPNEEISHVSSLVQSLDLGVPLEILNEDEFISTNAKKLILEKRADRFGWILQQILVCNFLLRTHAQHVLVVDADTLILRKQIWVDNSERQILMPSLEFHKPYYDFLVSQSELFGTPTWSFISHHMLFQTKYFRQMMNLWGADTDLLLRSALKFSSKEEASPFDLKYEPYAQYMLNNHRSLVNLTKWSNVSLKKSSRTDIVGQMNRKSTHLKKYNSLSLHHWS